MYTLGYDLNAEDAMKETPLHYAVADNNLEVVRTLIDLGADVARANGDGTTPLHYSQSTECAKILIRANAPIDARGLFGCTPLWNTNPEIVKLVLDSGADINTRDNDGQTILHWATQRNDAPLVKFILKRGGDPKLTNNFGFMALDFMEHFVHNPVITNTLIDFSTVTYPMH